MSDDELLISTNATVCARFKISREAVRQWRKNRGLPAVSRHGSPPKTAERREISKLLGGEMTNREIARKLNQSESLVSTVVRETGVPSRNRNPALTWGRNRVTDEELAAQTNRELARRLGIKDSMAGKWRKVRGIPSPKSLGWALKFAAGKEKKHILQDVPDEVLFDISREELAENYGCSLGTVTNERRRRKHAKV